MSEQKGFEVRHRSNRNDREKCYFQMRNNPAAGISYTNKNNINFKKTLKK